MEVTFYTDPEEFTRIVKPFLLKKEVENNLMIGILDRISQDLNSYGSECPILAIVKDQQQIVLVSTRTPPWNSILSYTENLDAVDFFVEELTKVDPDTPGILGPKDAVNRFVHKWKKLHNVKIEIGMNERIYKLTEVNVETLGTHEFIPAKKKHESLIRKWGYAFLTEAIPETPLDQIERSLTRAIEDLEKGNIFLLLDKGKPVSMARSACTDNWGKLNYVYTPPTLRRKGYATECVAKLTKKLLEEYEYCVLFTDLANPTSNSIYQKIGYKPVLDLDLYKFVQC